ncbi:MAG: hypothetical protein DWI03_07250 [Planctomycetota bacterium]|nr:MAG: hypothetical protein DWI03_07250 [Planctomycetota bacterium]
MAFFGRSLLAVLALAVTGRALADAPLYEGRFADGTRVGAAQFTAWHDAAGQPHLGGRAILDQANPLRWALTGGTGPKGGAASKPAAVVELVGGDRLPGVVEEYRSGQESLLERLPPHLIVRPTVPIDLPGRPPRTHVRVIASAVRRVVWQPGPLPMKPGTLRTLDGGELAFRSLRWTRTGVFVLADDGPRRLPFSELGEICPVGAEPWDAYFDSLARLMPDLTTRLLRADAGGGLVVTTSLERFRASGADAQQVMTWQHLFHPAWSLDPLWLPHSSIRCRWLFSPQEVPLPVIEVSRATRTAVFGGGWGWNVNQSAAGEQLGANGAAFGWGFGVQARCELEFPLPAIATAFRTGVALDDAAGSGGCAVARVCLDSPQAQPLWKSGMLVGTTDPVDTGAIGLALPAGKKSTLVLVADEAHEGRPAGADPYDIRDVVDWLDPVVMLNADALRTLVRERLPATIPAWKGWNVTLPTNTPLVVRNAFDGAPDGIGGYLPQVAPQSGPLTLARTVQVGPRQRYLAIGVSRGAVSPSRFEVRVDGVTASSADVPQRQPGVPTRPFFFPLARFAGKSVEVQVVHLPADANGLVSWHILEPLDAPDPGWVEGELLEARSEGGATLARQDDGSILVGGPAPENDAHLVRVRSDELGITALRFDALSDATLPPVGPGRSETGGFVLTGIEAEAASVADPETRRKLVFTAATASVEQPGRPAAAIIDSDPKSGWGANRDAAAAPIAVLLRLAEPVGYPGGTEITIRPQYAFGERHVPGRFRLSLTTAAEPALLPPGTLLVDTPPPSPPQ